MSDTVRLTKLEFENVGAIKSMTLKPSPITIILGRNGAGKSAICRAFVRLFRGGYDPKLIRKGCDKAVIRGEFSDGNYAIRILDRILKESTIKVYSQDGEEVRPFQKAIEEYATGYALDPLTILTDNKKKRLEYIEEMLDVRVTTQELLEACTESEFLRLFDPKASAFTNIDAISDAAYDQRTKINQDIGNLHGAVQTIREGVPSLNDEKVDWASAERDARNAYVDAEAALKLEQQSVADTAVAARNAEDQKLHSTIKEIEAEYQAALKSAEERKKTRVAEAELRCSQNRQIADAAEAAEMEAVRARLGDHIYSTRSRFEAAQAALAAWHKATGARDQILKLEEQIKVKAGRSVFLTNVLDRLKLLRMEKQKSNPVPDLEIKDGEIWYQGVEFDAVNTGKRYELCIQLAAMRSGKCPLMILDDVVNIDDERWRGFIAAAKGSGFQIVAARLDTGDLRIEEIDEAA